MSDEGIKALFRKMRDEGCTRERATQFSRWCGCLGCIYGREDGKSMPPCKCGMRCNCRCTMPSAVLRRLEQSAIFAQIIDEVWAEC